MYHKRKWITTVSGKQILTPQCGITAGGLIEANVSIGLAGRIIGGYHEVVISDSEITYPYFRPSRRLGCGLMTDEEFDIFLKENLSEITDHIINLLSPDELAGLANRARHTADDRAEQMRLF